MASNNGGGAPKDERRRRIAERGSDRMALITGRINALPPQPPSATSSPSYRSQPRHAQSLSAFDHHSDHHTDDQPRHLRPQSLSSALYAEFHEDHTGGAEGKQDATNPSSRLRHQGGFKYSNVDNLDSKKEVQPLMQDPDAISRVPDQGNEAKTKPSRRAQIAAALDTKQLKKPGRLKPAPFFSSRELNACIIASETTRALSSLIIAVVVVFFYMITESIVATRPLYILLLTDVTIVLSRLYYEKARLLEENEGIDEEHGDGHSWGDAVKLLERGLVAYQAIRGIFIDCSIYIVIVVCGISLM